MCSRSSSSSPLPFGKGFSHLPAMQETQIQSLGGEYPLEKERQPTPVGSCLGNPMDRGAWQATVHGVIRVRQDLVTKPALP